MKIPLEGVRVVSLPHWQTAGERRKEEYREEGKEMRCRRWLKVGFRVNTR